MRRRIASLLAVGLLATTATILAPSSPAVATGACAGTGTATTGAPLRYPITLVTSTTPSATLSVTQPTTTTFGFSLTTGLCVNTTGTATTVKAIAATGTLTGWCGHVSGSGVTSDGHRFAFTSVANALVLTGGLVGVVNAVFDVAAGEDCNAPKGSGADSFLITGAALKVHCNTAKDKRTVTLPLPSGLTTAGTDTASVGVHTGPMTYDTKVCVGTLL